MLYAGLPLVLGSDEITFLTSSVGLLLSIESLSRRRFCQHGRQPEVNRAVINGEWWRQPFSFEITNVKAE